MSVGILAHGLACSSLLCAVLAVLGESGLDGTERAQLCKNLRELASNSSRHIIMVAFLFAGERVPHHAVVEQSKLVVTEAGANGVVFSVRESPVQPFQMHTAMVSAELLTARW